MSSTLGNAVSSSAKALKSLGIVGSETQKKLTAIGTIDKNQTKLKQQSELLKVSIEKLKRAKEDLANSSGKSAAAQTRLTRRVEDAEVKVAKQLNKVRQLSEANIKYKKSVENLYGPIDKLKASHDSLAKSQQRLKMLHDSQTELKNNISERTQFMYAAEVRLNVAKRIARPMVSALDAAMEGEKARYYLGTLMEGTDAQKSASMKKFWEAGKDLATSGYAGMGESMDTMYALMSADMGEGLARSGAKVVASVAKITRGEMSQVGEILATAYKNLSGKMQGTEEQKFTRMGELLTKVQFKYQIRDFGQLGESMKMGAPAIAQYNANLEQSVSVLGQLNTAGLQGGMAGTAYNAFLRGTMKTAKDYPKMLVKMKDGSLDVISTLRRIKNGMRGMSDEERARFMSENWGDQGARGLALMLENFDALEKSAKEVKDSSKGIIDKNMQEYLKLTSTRIAAAKESLNLMTESLGGAFAPAVQSAANWLAKFADKAGAFADANPLLTKLIVGSAGALVGVNLLTAGVLYLGTGFSTLKTIGGGALHFMKLFQAANAGTNVSMLAGGKAAMILSKGYLFMTKSLLPVLAAHAAALVAIGAIIAVAYLVYKHWDKVKKFFVDLWSSFETRFPAVAKVIGGAAKLIAGYYKIIWEALKKVWEFGQKALKFMGLGGGEVPQADGKGNDRARGGGGRKHIPRMAAGGFVNSPTVALVGEAGPELVLPLKDRLRSLALLSSAGIGEAGGGSASISFSPTFVIQGNADAQTMRQTARMSLQEFKSMLERVLREERRVSLA